MRAGQRLALLLGSVNDGAGGLWVAFPGYTGLPGADGSGPEGLVVRAQEGQQCRGGLLVFAVHDQPRSRSRRISWMRPIRTSSSSCPARGCNSSTVKRRAMKLRFLCTRYAACPPVSVTVYVGFTR